ncbi:LysR substrate-binding domain-containing protein [Pseudodonghicola xiamenensis]|uniref:LysR family transcriptional regulator n=1 Tax=Pseudodonghicola xiamenensis TaxID=337702 RepID=A0A8J3H9A0_9RHOB|nr:LysR substrate-binding domain-containing protein [Pseudodonghicola xiamenensis]GHG92908.1 LysR family transcriptional regulator [Pseudodonghicola xiamenensis]
MRRLPPLHALRAFEAAARHLHFARAAAELHLTPTAISHQIRQLEEILEVKLFHRYPRPIRLTSEGAGLYPVLRESFDRMASAIAKISQPDTDRPLTVSVTVAFASLWLIRRLPALRSEAGLNLKVEADNRPVDLSGSDVDFAVRYAAQPEPEDQWLPLFEDRLIPLCSPDLLRRTPVNDDPGVLRLPLIQYRWNCGVEAPPSWQRWSHAAGLGGAAPEITQHFSEEINAIDAALAGQGVVLASSVLATSAVAAGHLVRLSETELPARTFWAVSRRDHPRFAEVEHFASWARASG